MSHEDVNKPTKREFQKILSKELLMQSKWCELITENENKQEGSQNTKANNRIKKETKITRETDQTIMTLTQHVLIMLQVKESMMR